MTTSNANDYQYALCAIHHKPICGDNLKCEDCRKEEEQAIRDSQDAKWRECIIASTEGKRGKGYGYFCGWCTEQWTEGGCGEPEPCPFRKLAEDGVEAITGIVGANKMHTLTIESLMLTREDIEEAYENSNYHYYHSEDVLQRAAIENALLTLEDRFNITKFLAEYLGLLAEARGEINKKEGRQ